MRGKAKTRMPVTGAAVITTLAGLQDWWEHADGLLCRLVPIVRGWVWQQWSWYSGPEAVIRGNASFGRDVWGLGSVVSVVSADRESGVGARG